MFGLSLVRSDGDEGGDVRDAGEHAANRTLEATTATRAPVRAKDIQIIQLDIE
jgi:hypothetical protein